MTTGYSYDGSVPGTSSFIAQIATMAVVDQTDPNFVTILPQAITYAENRICRELDFLFSSVANASFKLTANSRNITIPSDIFVVPEQINVITPQNATSIDSGTRNPLLPVTREFIDATCSNPANVGVPKYFAPVGNSQGNLTFIVGPFPDAAYPLEIIGTIRPDSMSQTNLTTFISIHLPDLLSAATMIYVSGYQRNFGATAANDPQMPVSWETIYMTAMKGAAGEEFRKKFQASAWSSKTPSPLASPTRG